MTTTVGEPEIEEVTQRLGHEMFDRMRAGRPSILNAEWWEERLMGVFMQNEWLKVQAFRFIDALPMMSSDADVARHLKEYLVHPSYARNGGDGHHHSPEQERKAALAELQPDGARAFVKWVSRLMNFERLDSPRARLLAWAARKSSVMMAGRFIAGSNVQQTVRAIRRMRHQRLAFTVDVLGEAAVSRVEADRYQQVYLDLLTELPRHAAAWPTVPLIDEGDGVPVPRVNVSVKLTALNPGLDALDPGQAKRAAKDRLRPLLRKAMETGAHVHIDIEHYAIKALTLDICRELFTEDEFRDYPHFGIVLQAYLKEGDRDAAETLEWVKRRGVPIWVRLVKGAYWDSETVWAEQARWPCPVWEQKWQSDACFERVTRVLLENHKYICSAFASHNIRSLAHAMALQRLLDVPSTAFELQMLYGMGDPIKRAGVEMGQRCRIYTPYGEILPGMAYFIRRLLENTANESFLRHTVDEDTPEDELLTGPEEVGRCTPPFNKPDVVRYEFEEAIMDPFENVPNTDFTREPSRQEMLSGLAQVRAEMGREFPLIIGGQRVTTGQWADSLNPSRPSEVVGRLAQADRQTVERAVKAAAKAFATWRRVSPHERAEYLFKVAEVIGRRRFELAALEAIECGKPWREADADISQAIDFCNYYGKEMMRLADNVRRRDIAGETNEYYYGPRGVVAVVSSWNFPLLLPTSMTAAALVTGNTVVLKPANLAGVVAAKLVAMFEEAGLPTGVLNYVPGPGATAGKLLVQHPQVAIIAFTGSREVGRRINRLAAETLTSEPGFKRVIAEMGGKNAIIIDSDADLDEAIRGVIASAFGYAGQKCSAASRVIALAQVHDRFVARLVEAMRTASVGPAEEPGTFVPPVIDQNAFESVRKHIEIGKSEAKCALEVDVRRQIEESGGGYYIGPTIFTDVPPDARIAQEEIFGPVLTVIKAADFDQALEIFNGTEFALTGGIYSRSPANITRARNECECGNLFINRKITGALVDLQPFGGFKMSGIGSKAGGPDYLIRFCEPRSVTENTLRRGFAPSEEVAEQSV